MKGEKFPAIEYTKVKNQWLGIECMIKPTIEREVGKRIGGKRVLDVGCGNGPYMLDFLKWGASHVVGIDLNEEMIESCKAKFADNLQLGFHVQSASEMSYSGEFDLALAIFVLHFMETFDDLEKALFNIGKALKPGGEFLAFVPNGNPMVRFGEEEGKKFGACLKIPEHPTPPVDGNRIKIIFYDNQETVVGNVDATFFYTETYEKLLRKAGFSKIEWIEPYISPKFIEQYGEDYFQCILDPPHDLVLYAVKD